jgi:hypothetical protein
MQQHTYSANTAWTKLWDRLLRDANEEPANEGLNEEAATQRIAAGDKVMHSTGGTESVAHAPAIVHTVVASQTCEAQHLDTTTI